MTARIMNSDLEKLSTLELLDENPNSAELMTVKERVRAILEILDKRKETD